MLTFSPVPSFWKIPILVRVSGLADESICLLEGEWVKVGDGDDLRESCYRGLVMVKVQLVQGNVNETRTPQCQQNAKLKIGTRDFVPEQSLENRTPWRFFFFLLGAAK